MRVPDNQVTSLDSIGECRPGLSRPLESRTPPARAILTPPSGSACSEPVGTRHLVRPGGMDPRRSIEPASISPHISP